jgi:hypothetical protein
MKLAALQSQEKGCTGVNVPPMCVANDNSSGTEHKTAQQSQQAKKMTITKPKIKAIAPKTMATNPKTMATVAVNKPLSIESCS